MGPRWSSARSLLLAAIFAVHPSVYAIGAQTDKPVLLRVEIRPQVQVAQSQVTLGDIADLSSVDLPLLRRAMSLPLGRTPRVGDVVSLESERVQRWLFSQTGLRMDQIEWAGALSTDIRCAGRQISGDALVEAAQASLQKHLETASTQGNLPAAKIELHPLSIPTELSIPASATALRVRRLDNIPVSKRMLVWIDVYAAEHFLRAIPIRFEVSVFAAVPVAASALAVGEALDASQLIQREADITQLVSRGVKDITYFANGIETPSPQRLRHSVQRGEVVTPAHVEKIPTISRGEWANLTAQYGLVALESRVEVLQDGYVGQMVRVKQANASSPIFARVAGPGHLEMQP